MKTRYLIWTFSLVLLCIFHASESFSRDPGIPDTVRFAQPSISLTGPPYEGACVLPVLVFNDEHLLSIEIPLRWQGPLLCDSGKFVGERSLYFLSSHVFYDNEMKVVYATASTIYYDSLIPPGEGELLYLYFSILDTGFVSIDTAMLYGWMYLHFMDGLQREIDPQFIPIEFHIPLAGDVNGDGVIDLGDLLALVNYLYKNAPPPDFVHLGDVNGDCVIDLGDVLYLVSYLYKGGPVPQAGCAL